MFGRVKCIVGLIPLTLRSMRATIQLRHSLPHLAFLPPLSFHVGMHAGIYATMHLSYGIGFLFGCCRYGPPFAGFASLLAAPRNPG